MSDDSGLTREPKWMTDRRVRDKITTIRATVDTAYTQSTDVKTTVDNFKTLGLGMTDPQVLALQSDVDDLVHMIEDITAALDASGL